MIVAQFVTAIVVGYLMGSIPFGVLVGRISSRVDVRDFGSGKTGATNVLRTSGRKAALLVVLMDVLKGSLAVVFAGMIVGKNALMVGDVALEVMVAQSGAALAAVAGHIWPVFLKFRGGRGVATFFGGLAALSLLVAVIGAIILFATMALTRFASVGSIAGAAGTFVVLLPLTLLNGESVAYLAYSLAGAALVIAMHRDNIGRLMAGTERRIGEKVALGGRQGRTSQESPGEGRS